MDCQRIEELLSDHLEGTLHQILRAEVDAHLASCEACGELRRALAEVVASLRNQPVPEVPAGLATRAARAALLRARPQAPTIVLPALAPSSWVQAAAAGLALIALGTMLLVIGPERPTRMAHRIVNRTVAAGSQLEERKERLVDDVRILGLVLTTAFEGRVDRVNERVEDYRRLLEKRRSEPTDRKSGSSPEIGGPFGGDPSPGVGGSFASGFRTDARAST